jgi:hypothetical protein
MTSKIRFSFVTMSVITCLIVISGCFVLANAATVTGTIKDTEGNPIDNIRIVFRGGVVDSDAEEFNTDWYFEDMVRVGPDGKYQFAVPEPGYSIDSNHIFMLYSISGVDEDSKIWNTAASDRFLVREGLADTVVGLITSRIVHVPMVVKIELDNGDAVAEVSVGATLLVNAGGTEAGTTNADGYVIFNEAVAGDYRVTACKAGYETVSASYTLSPGVKDTLVIMVPQTNSHPTTGEIRGILTEPDGNPINGGIAAIKLGSKTNREVFVGISDENGKFIIGNIPDYYLGIEGKIETGANGFQDMEEMWVVSTTDLELEYTLVPVGGNGGSDLVFTNTITHQNPIRIVSTHKGLEIVFPGRNNVSGIVNVYTADGRTVFSGVINYNSGRYIIPHFAACRMVFVRISLSTGQHVFPVVMHK